MKNFSKILFLLIFLPITVLGQVWTTPIVPSSSFPSSDYFGLIRGNNQNIFINAYIGSPTEAYQMVVKISEINGNIVWMKNDTISPYITGYYKLVTINNKNKVVALMTPLSGTNYYLSFRNQNSGNLIEVKQISKIAALTSYGDSLIGISNGNGASLFVFDEHGNQTRSITVINDGETIYRIIPKIIENTLWVFGKNYSNGYKGFVQKMDIITGYVYWRVNFLDVIDARGEIDPFGNSYYVYLKDESVVNPFQIVKLDSSGNIVWQKQNLPNRGIPANQENFPHSLSFSLLKNEIVLGAAVERDSLLNTPRDAGYIHIRNATTGDSISSFKIIEDTNSKVNTVEAITFDEYGNLYVLGKCYYQGPTPSWGWVKKYDSLLTEITILPIQTLSGFELAQNYPNPFNPTTNIKFDIQKTSPTKLVVYDALGREVATLVNEELKAGSYQTDWDGSNYTSGVYFYTLQSGDYIETRKMLLLK